MGSMREVFVFTKDANGGIASLLEQFSRLESQDLQFKLFLYRESPLHVFAGKVEYINRFYPEDLAFSLDKIYILIKNVIRTYFLLRKYSIRKTLFACDMYSALVLLVLKLITGQGNRVICLVNSNFQRIIAQKSNPFYRLTLRWFVRFLYRQADHIVYVSQDLMLASNTFLNIYPKKASCIQNGISRTVVAEKMSMVLNDMDLQNMKSDPAFKVISVGRLVDQKDFQSLLLAFAEVHKKLENTSLYIIGDGVLREKLETLSRELHIKEYVHFLGWKDNIYPFYKEADVFVLSTHYEGFGRVLLEAMACQLPVISTDVNYGPAEILHRGEFGVLIPEGNVSKLTDSIMQFINDSSKRKKYSNLADKRVGDFSENEMFTRYKKMFMNL